MDYSEEMLDDELQLSIRACIYNIEFPAHGYIL